MPSPSSGWFILLTSLLGFWRVKRWERSILESQNPAPSQPQPSHSGTPDSSSEGSTDRTFDVLAEQLAGDIIDGMAEFWQDDWIID